MGEMRMNNTFYFVIGILAWLFMLPVWYSLVNTCSRTTIFGGSMKIIDETTKGTVSFNGMPLGRVFKYEGVTYLKVNRAEDLSGNAVSLISGETYFIQSMTMVTPVEAELTIKK